MPRSSRNRALTAPELIRRRLEAHPSATQALRLWRSERSLVALVGSWTVGEALIAFDPVDTLKPDTDPFGALEHPASSSAANASQFTGGWLGAWGYQLSRHIEAVPVSAPRPIPTPDFTLSYYDWALVLRSGCWWFEAAPGAGRRETVEAAYGKIAAALRTPCPDAQPYALSKFTLDSGATCHREAVARARAHIEAGDIFQANICLRLDAEFDGDPLDVFCVGVDSLQPAYGAFVRTAGGAIASFSPELFLRRTGDLVQTSPIKGTAPLHTDPGELIASAKDRAENIMIVDLMRNDLSRVSVPGTVHVERVAGIERHAVWHLVSDINAQLRPGVGNGDLLRATFPPGSVTGAPKVRAMEIINELESTGREAYTGAIGRVGAVDLELNVAIRTFEFHAERVWLGAGGAITMASSPAAEFEECLDKARPLLQAIGAELDVDARRLDAASTPAPDPASAPVPAGVLASRRRSSWRADAQQGVFTTMLVNDGMIADAQQHLDRFAASLRGLYDVRLPADIWAQLTRQAAGLAGPHRLRMTGLSSGAIRCETSQLRPDAGPWSFAPVVVPGGLGSHKWNDRPPLDPEALVLDVDGALLETVRANVFIVRDDAICTPPLDGRILAGVARARLIEQLRVAGIPVREHNLTLADLAGAIEVFATNSLRGVVPVVGCEGVGSWPVGQTTRSLRDRFAHRGDEWASTQAAAVEAPTPASVVGRGARVLLIDNYDSFVYNLAHYVAELGAHTDVVRNDATTVDELMERARSGDITHLIVSPGPGTPADAGISNEVIRRLGPLIPTLGVCLGHQCIGAVFGANIVRAPQVVHGRSSLIHHDRTGIFAGLSSPLVAARYHSLTIEPTSLPRSLVATAHTADGTIMAVRHRSHRIVGIQVHPESILTTHGHELLAAFLQSVG